MKFVETSPVNELHASSEDVGELDISNEKMETSKSISDCESPVYTEDKSANCARNNNQVANPRDVEYFTDDVCHDMPPSYMSLNQQDCSKFDNINPAPRECTDVSLHDTQNTTPNAVTASVIDEVHIEQVFESNSVTVSEKKLGDVSVNKPQQNSFTLEQVALPTFFPNNTGLFRKKLKSRSNFSCRLGLNSVASMKIQLNSLGGCNKGNTNDEKAKKVKQLQDIRSRPNGCSHTVFYFFEDFTHAIMPLFPI